MAPSSLAIQSKADKLSKYDPQGGLKKVAVAEAAEKFFARAKDPTQLERAIRAKLEAQAEFVFWWDTKGPGTNHGGDRRSKNQDGRSAVLIRAGQDGLPEEYVIRRWRKRLNQPEKFEETYAAAVKKYIAILEQRQNEGTAGADVPRTNEWYTPSRYIEAARSVMGGIDLDPASNARANETVLATKFYTAKDDGLRQEWGGRVWLNPPYSGLSGDFTKRLIEEFGAGRVSQGVLLVNAHSTDTEWFLGCWDFLLCFTDHRINFISPTTGSAESGSNHGSVFVYLGPARSSFIREFAVFGAVMERAR